jgi:hypothetical protein
MTDTQNREWTDIASEEYREYTFPKGEKVRIEKPQKLNVSASGGHRIVDSAGLSHYIPPTWIHLQWKGEPNFVK